MSARRHGDGEAFAAQGADERREIVIGRLAASDPDPAITCVLRRDVVRAFGDLLLSRHLLLPVVRVARGTADRTAGQAHKAHLESAQMAFALDGPENGITR